MDGYASEDKESYSNLSSTAFEQYSTFVYLEQSNREKYGNILTGLSTQYSLGNDQYPKSMAEANMC